MGIPVHVYTPDLKNEVSDNDSIVQKLGLILRRTKPLAALSLHRAEQGRSAGESTQACSGVGLDWSAVSGAPRTHPT